MGKEIYEKLEDFFHNKTLSSDDWYKKENCERNKFDEIQIFLGFLRNKKELILSNNEFLKDFKYKEKDLEEPQDLVYKKQGYQITYGDKEYKGIFEKNRKQNLKQSSTYCNIFSRKRLIDCEINDDINPLLSEIDKIADCKTILLIYLEHSPKDFLENCQNFKKTIRYQLGWKNLFLIACGKNIKVY